MEWHDYIKIISIGICAGFFNVVAGGGSLLTLPILISLGLTPGIANGTNRIALVIQNLFAVSGFKSKKVESTYPYKLYLAIAAVPGSILGALFSTKLEDALFSKIIAVVMVLVIGFMVLSPNKSTTKNNERLDFKHQIIGAIVFFFIGMYGGFIQAGVGFLIMAAISNINHMSLVKTNAIKVFVILIYTLSALAVFIWKGAINWEYGLSLAVGSSTGAWIASRWSVKAGDIWIKRILVVAVLGLAVKLWFYS